MNSEEMGAVRWERFWRKVGKGTEPEDCWLWMGYVNYRRGGYGYHYIGGRLRRAHRLAYELLVGPIPDGLHLDHLCRNPRCVNPGHLEPVTAHENVRRGQGHGSETHCPSGHAYDSINTRVGPDNKRYCRACGRVRDRARRARRKRPYVVRRGEENPNSRLTWTLVRQIRELTRVDSRPYDIVIAHRFGLSRSQVQKIRAGTVWQEVAS